MRIKCPNCGSTAQPELVYLDHKSNSTRKTEVKRERKPKPEKAEICSAMMEGLAELGVEDFNITNPEREFLFTHNGTKYKVTLACPRS